MDLKIDIDPADIKAAVVNAVVNSAIGLEIKKAIDQALKEPWSRENIIAKAVKQMVTDLALEEVRKVVASDDVRKKIIDAVSSQHLDPIIDRIVREVIRT